MLIRRRRRREAHACEGCGKVRDLTGEYPDGPLLCEPCNGLFTCRCCRLSRGEYKGRAGEYEGDAADYVCRYCRDGCSYDTPGSECLVSPRRYECGCPAPAGPVLPNCPRCGACNHTDLDIDTRLVDGSVLGCEDCGQDVKVRLIAQK